MKRKKKEAGNDPLIKKHVNRRSDRRGSFHYHNTILLFKLIYIIHGMNE